MDGWMSGAVKIFSEEGEQSGPIDMCLEIQKPAKLSLGLLVPFPLLDSRIQGSGW